MAGYQVIPQISSNNLIIIDCVMGIVNVIVGCGISAMLILGITYVYSFFG